MAANQILEVSRTDHGTTRITDEPLGELGPNAVRFRIDVFSITANTVTYANAGDLLGYWDFYPTGDDAWGRTPAMGWAEIIESNHPDVAVGGRYYGWFPMARFVDITVAPTSTGVRDMGDHRSGHAGVYRTLEAADRDPLLLPVDGVDIAELEQRHALVRGLYLTGYLAAAFFRANDWFDRDSVIVLSASSKTGLAFAEAATRLGAKRIVGVTSERNLEFVEDAEWYDDAVTYDAILDGEHELTEGCIVDMAGNQAVVAALHQQLDRSIGYTMLIGMTHHDQPPVEVSGGPKPEWFFAPTALTAMADRGTDPAQVQRDAATALADFIGASTDWLTIERVRGSDSAAETWTAVHAGGLPASVGRIVSMH